MSKLLKIGDLPKHFTPRHKDEFKVSVTIPCPKCNVLKPEKEIKDQVRYVFQHGYVRDQCCDACFDAQVKAAEKEVATNAAKPINYDY